MTIPNPTYRYIHELTYGRKKGKTEELYGIAHDLLTAALDSAVTLRNASCVFAAMAERENNLGKYRLCEEMGRRAAELESAVKAAGGYKTYPPEQAEGA